jgi:hypothetical protein
MEVIGDGLLVDLRDPLLLGPRRAGEVAQVVDDQRGVGGERLAHRLAVVVALRDGRHLQVVLDRVGHRQEDLLPLSGRALRPARLRRVGGVEGELDVLGGRVGDRAERLTGNRAEVLPVPTPWPGRPIRRR